MIPLYGDVDLTTMKSIHVDVEWGLLLLHHPSKTGMIFQGRVRNFELSSALLPFATAESLRLPEVFLFRVALLSFSAARVVIGGGVLNFPFSKARISLGVFVRSVKNLSGLFSWLTWSLPLKGLRTWPLAIISSTVFGNFLMESF
ncbi:hypothetical protein Tco_1335475 [Tanacetum coccineum]